MNRLLNKSLLSYLTLCTNDLFAWIIFGRNVIPYVKYSRDDLKIVVINKLIIQHLIIYKKNVIYRYNYLS